MIQDLF